MSEKGDKIRTRMTVMNRLKSERIKLGWSQQTLGFHAGVSASEISRFEHGWAKPYPAQAERLAKALGLRPEELQQAPIEAE